MLTNSFHVDCLWICLKNKFEEFLPHGKLGFHLCNVYAMKYYDLV
jgi:hypothetical protein